MDDWQIDVKGKTILDVGCNVGALACEIMRRGARRVIGLEFHPERVELCEKLFAQFGFDGEFHQVDLRTLEELPKADITFCCSVCDYIADWRGLYKKVATATGEHLCLEVNRQGHIRRTTRECLESLGFEVKILGQAHSGGISRQRTMYSCRRPAR